MKRRHEILRSISKNSKLSDFERKVYRAALDIPKGETRSYKWIAARTGSPRSSRAVGNALNKNPYPVIVPCHRVVRSDNSIGGFAKGSSMKRRMLKREGVDLGRFKLL